MSYLYTLPFQPGSAPSASVSLGNILYVSLNAPIANDSQTRAQALGNILSPFRTPSAAANVANDGDTLVIYAQTYAGFTVLNKTLTIVCNGRVVINGDVYFNQSGLFTIGTSALIGENAILNGKIRFNTNSFGQKLIVQLETINTVGGNSLENVLENRGAFFVSNTIINNLTGNLMNALHETSVLDNITVTATNAILEGDTYGFRGIIKNSTLNINRFGGIRTDSVGINTLQDVTINLTATPARIFFANFTGTGGTLNLVRVRIAGAATQAFINASNRAINVTAKSCDFQALTLTSFFNVTDAFGPPTLLQWQVIFVGRTLLQTGATLFLGLAPVTPILDTFSY